MTMEKFRDDYSFSTEDRVSFMRELNDIREDSEWIPEIKGSDLQISSIQPIEVVPMSLKYNIPEEILSDTAANEGTQLLLHNGNQTECIRTTAYAGLLQTAVGLSGPGIGRLWKRSSQIFCDSLNEFLRAQNGQLKLYKSCGKISGVFSNNYNEMEIIDLIYTAEDAFSLDLGTPRFIGGHIEHALTSCTWDFPEVEDAMMEKYRNMIEQKTHSTGVRYKPIVSMLTSNTGASAATLVPKFVAPGKAAFHIGTGIRIRHDNRQIGTATGCGMDAFMRQASEMFNLFNESFEMLCKMADFKISNPGNAFIAACNWCFGERLPRKLASAALEEFNSMIGSRTSCTMYELFLSISEINNQAEKANLTFDRRVEISECIARLFKHRNWGELDVAGVVAWNGTKGGLN